MNRRELLLSSAVLGVGAVSMAAPPGLPGNAGAPAAPRLAPPARGPIPVAFLISRGAVVIDFCGPWEVFENVTLAASDEPAFRLYTVAESADPVTVSGGMQIVPNFTFAAAPQPSVLVIPAQDGGSDAAIAWIRQASLKTDLTMSVCTGAFLLAKTGLLDGKSATTHHAAYGTLAMEYPAIRVVRGARFVEEGKLASSGGLTSGIDLSLRVVERYFGRTLATKTADDLEYQGQGWLNPDSNESYRARRVSTAAHPLCPVCEMDVDPKSAPRSTYLGETYYFCMASHKEAFDEAPASFVAMLKAG
jgi:putative intracellular protease/amidase/YHS domain-containing protein